MGSVGKPGAEMDGMRVSWTSSDFRFTRRDDTLYAFMLAWPDDRRAVVRSLTGHETVTGVRLLGHGPVPFEQAHGVLVVRLPDTAPVDVANCLAIDLAG